jgi:two-component system response regulator VicR
MNILVIDDDEEILNIITLTLKVGFPDAEVLTEMLGKNGLEIIEAGTLNVIILDLGLPDMSGFEVLRRTREISDVPVIILTVSEDESKIVRALEMGADDYITKPFRQMELLARVRSVMRKSNVYSGDDMCQVIGSIRFYSSGRKIKSGKREISVTPTEYSILLHLARNKGKTVPYSSIANLLWGGSYPKTKDAIRVYIRHLREKLESDPANPTEAEIKEALGGNICRCGTYPYHIKAINEVAKGK